MAKEELTMNLPEWWAKQPFQTFEVISADGRITRVRAHEVSVGMPGSAQPILSFVRYELREIEATKVTGGTKNKEETTETVSHPIMIYSASFNAGSWISFRDVDAAEIVETGASIKGQE